MKKKKNEEEKERRTPKLKFSSFLFSASELSSKTPGTFLTIILQMFLSVRVSAHFAVVFLELLPYLKYRQPFLN